MKLNVRNDPMGWSFETFRQSEPWLTNPASPSPLRLDHSDLPGLVLGGAFALASLFLATTIPAQILDNVTAALLGAGGLMLIATALVIGRLAPAIGLAAIGLVVLGLTYTGITSPIWLPAAAVAGAVGGWFAMRNTEFRTVFAAWAWFHGFVAAALVVI